MLENAEVFLKIYSIISIVIIGIRMFFGKKIALFDLATLVFVFIYVANV